MNIIRSVTVAVTTSAVLLAGCGTTKADDKPTVAASSAPADNGIAALTVPEILKRVEQALATAKSFHLSGSGQSNGSAMSFDLKQSGEDLLGVMSADGGKIEVLLVGGRQYFRLNEQMAVMALGRFKLGLDPSALSRTWLRPAAGNTEFTSLVNGFRIADLLASAGGDTKGGTTVVDGRPAIVLRDAKSGDALYVATTGEALPLKLGADGGDLTFGEFGATFPEIAAPAAGSVYQLPSKTKKS
jgi:hypothetical protein